MILIPEKSVCPYISKTVDGALNHVIMARALEEHVSEGKPSQPSIFHDHYVDAGDIAARLLIYYNVTFNLNFHNL